MTDTGVGGEVITAIIDHVDNGAYPKAQGVVSAGLPAAALPDLIEVVKQKRDAVEREICTISRGSASDVDGWISQARQLQQDIEQSKQTARQIVQEAEAAKTLKATLLDTGNKVRLLKEEVVYTQTIADTLEQLQISTGLYDSAQNALEEEDVPKALDKLDEAQRVDRQYASFQRSRFAMLLQQRASQLRDSASSKLFGYWATFVEVEPAERCVSIQESTDASPLSFIDIATAMDRMNILPTAVSRLHRDLDNLILAPRFNPAANGALSSLQIEAGQIRSHGRLQSSSAPDAVRDFHAVIQYLSEHLPKEVSHLLLERMLPSLEMQLVTKWLDPAVPVKLNDMSGFDATIKNVSDLAAYLSSFEVAVPKDADLGQWVDRLPQTWLARRKEAMLAGFRSQAPTAVKERKTAEIVETQVVAEEEITMHEVPVGDRPPQQHQEEDWGAEWDDEGGSEKAEVTAGKAQVEQVEDEDVSAWGIDEDQDETEAPHGGKAVSAANRANGNPESKINGAEHADDDDGGDAWGWDEDDNDEGTQPKPQAIGHDSKWAQEGNQHLAQNVAPSTSPKEITLRESYAVTAVPETILTLIHTIMNDASVLSSEQSPVPQLTLAAPALSTLPTLLLAFYRATASTYYESIATANMYMYNDVQHLMSLLEEFTEGIEPSHPLKKRLRLDNDLKQLSSFAKRAYGREMDSQRTIMRDLLESVSGFANCTNPINNREYKSTLENVIERVKDVDKSWRDVIAESVRLQSVGSLLGTVIQKMTADILELADEDSGISEEQSQILKGFCDQVSTLSSLFTEPPNKHDHQYQQNPAETDGQEARSLVHVYAPGWLRFRYLAEVLEASLADIKYMWLEEGLSYEFEKAEVIDLIEALFADSDHRKNAIREIKGSGR